MTDADIAGITVSREIRARVARVYALWLDPGALLSWFGMDGITNIGCEVDARVGGVWRVEALGPNGVFSVGGVYHALEPGRRIAMSWVHTGADGRRAPEMSCEVLFAETARGTRVTVHHRAIRSTPELFREGWVQSLGRFATMAG